MVTGHVSENALQSADKSFSFGSSSIKMVTTRNERTQKLLNSDGPSSKSMWSYFTELCVSSLRSVARDLDIYRR